MPNTKLIRKEPYYIQRCILDRENDKLRYDYMGSTEFEMGKQAESLKRMHKGKLEIKSCTVKGPEEKDVVFYIVACNNFDFSGYSDVICGLLHSKWRIKEPTYLDLLVERKLGLTDNGSFAEDIEAWFDFTNDVFFTLTEENAKTLVSLIDKIKTTWEEKEKWLNSPKVKKFQKRLEKIKNKLKKADKNWIFLGNVQEFDDGSLHVWLNPFEQNKHNAGWYTLKDLEDWVKNKGPVMKKVES